MTDASCSSSGLVVLVPLSATAFVEGTLRHLRRTGASSREIDPNRHCARASHRRDLRPAPTRLAIL